MRKTYRVVDAITSKPLEGKVTAALVRASEIVGGSGIVVRQSAYLSKGAWYHLAPTEVEHFVTHLGVEVHSVYVEEIE